MVARPAVRRTFVACALVWVACATPAWAQLGNLLSPGRLAKAHAQLEGLSNCQQCHESGRKVTAAKCLACHAPVALRMSRRTGVHKDVKDECVTCHADHAGVTGELRPFDPKAFDHARVTAFPLEGVHANLEDGCAACHKQRTYLDQKSDCASCHRDIHKPSLGASCQTCHSTRTAFKEVGSGFDHTRAAFQLTGAHRRVSCEKCHANQVFKGVAFSTCASCHKDPHRQAFGSTCTGCHAGTDTWRTRQIDHSKTAFALVGRHQKVDCAGCHTQPATRVKPKADRCAACHADVHRGAFAQDCKSCHHETSFSKAPFDHGTTRFTLTGKHAPLRCDACHTSMGGQAAVPAAKRVADFRGLGTACASCHADVHQAQLGAACETCHTDRSFKVPAFTHTVAPSSFFGGLHASLTCAQCHLPQGPQGVTQPVRTGVSLLATVRYRGLATTCASCHQDVHLGQEGTACDTCHTLAAPKFAVPDFAHARTTFALTGKHETTPCGQCHARETGAFPAGQGTAVRFKGIARACAACHKDVHLGQLDARCESCHATTAFAIAQYSHRNAKRLSRFFVGAHARATCQACHPPATTSFPAGKGTAVRFAVDAGCVSCHKDVHRGALGPDCATCHRL